MITKPKNILMKIYFTFIFLEDIFPQNYNLKVYFITYFNLLIRLLQLFYTIR